MWLGASNEIQGIFSSNKAFHEKEGGSEREALDMPLPRERFRNSRNATFHSIKENVASLLQL
jgi:hypothetical protein